ncbi:MAG: hypothetical protein Q4B08_02415 [Propionibacteriaceae bacterium]|nr:hypothetical protein [Propionibacteriaceae bacterium]
MTADRTRRGGSTPSELASGRPHQSLAGEPWGGLSEPLQRLSRNTVLVSNATANESGRLGGGQRALVALTESGTGWGRSPTATRWWRTRSWAGTASGWVPFAADLLAGLASAPRQGERRFDGTWQPDSAAYAEAWLRLSQC